MILKKWQILLNGYMPAAEIVTPLLSGRSGVLGALVLAEQAGL